MRSFNCFSMPNLMSMMMTQQMMQNIAAGMPGGATAGTAPTMHQFQETPIGGGGAMASGGNQSRSGTPVNTDINANNTKEKSKNAKNAES